jgi:hypothetical protein
MSTDPQSTELCGICGGTGLVSQEFFDRCQSDGLHCLPAGTRCYCTVTPDEIVAELPSLIEGILDRSITNA